MLLLIRRLCKCVLFKFSVDVSNHHVLTDLRFEAKLPAKGRGAAQLRKVRDEIIYESSSERKFVSEQRLSQRRCVLHPSLGGSIIAAIGDAVDRYSRWVTLETLALLLV